jgi:ATP/maltotriose-dependent transcriptional regulator MalT
VVLVRAEDPGSGLLRLADELRKLDAELSTELEAHAGALAAVRLRQDRGIWDRIEAWDLDSEPTTEAQRMKYALASWYLSNRNLPAARCLELVERASASDLYRGDARSEWPFWMTLYSQACAGRAADALPLVDFAVDDARRMGSAAWTQVSLSHRSYFQLAVGNLEAAASDALESLENEGSQLWLVQVGPANAIRALTERGDLPAAEALVDRFEDVLMGTPSSAWQAMFFEARGELALVTGDAHSASADFERARDMLLPMWSGGAWFQWRRGMVLALNALAETDAAVELADEDVRFAREFGATHVLGAALRVRGVAAGGRAGLDDLREAVKVLDGGQARLEWAKALVDLGSALRRANRRQEAREPLRQGQELAHRCGARGLAERARIELEATGARPRSIVLSGAESLTPSELRVARLAADGLTNREIAQNLFVTMKTVETHLRHCYQKLEIAGRGELAQSLEPTLG